jgi:RNase adapter protein RapZ
MPRGKVAGRRAGGRSAASRRLATREHRSKRSREARRARKASLHFSVAKGDPRSKRSRGGQPFIILTGLSGSGKSQAIRGLEDLGYFCVDNLPTTLIPTLAKLSMRAGGDIEKVAIVVDVREGGFLSSFPKIFRRLQKMPKLNPVLIFLEADHAALVRRFSETRRPHPLAPDRSVTEGIRDERTRLNVIREMADEIVDTSDMTVHELRQFFMGLSRDRTRARLVVTVLSFGFKHGVPVDADLVFDVRCLPNPHFVPTLRRRTGRDKAVADFLERDASTRQFMDRLEEYLRYLVPFYVAEGKSYLTVAIGCTGGRHRSVMIAERLRRALSNVGVARVRVRHRDLAHQ